MFAAPGSVKREAARQAPAGAGFRPAGRAAARTAALGLLILLACLAGCRTAPIEDVTDFPLPPVTATADIAAIDEAIWRAGRKVGWGIERLSPGDLRGTWRYKQHLAVVRIHHDGSRLSIRYEDSVKLLREGQRIHKDYNHMVKRLLQAIQRELVAMLPSSAQRLHSDRRVPV